MTPARAPSPRRTFGGTWWGKAWIEALEKRAALDPNRLPRGRTYARQGRAGRLRVDPGAIHAAVMGSRREPYSVHVGVRQFSDSEWDRVLDAIAARAGHTAALLDGELDPSVVADAGSCGVSLLPGPGDLKPRCSCPDWADPCKHAAAVVYLMADVLDADPFALLLVRGRSRDQVLSALRERRAGGRRGALTVAASEAGVVARVAYARARAGVGAVAGAGVAGAGVAGAGVAGAGVAGGRALPPVPLPPRAPGTPTPLVSDPPAGSGLRRLELTELAADAARRAWELCVGDGDGGLSLAIEVDTVRRAAATLHSPSHLDAVARRAGIPVKDLTRRAAAWEAGGAPALEVVDGTWEPPEESIEEARLALARWGVSRVQANRVTIGRGDIQLRLARDRSWYRFDKVGREWELTGGPAADPAILVLR